jgi:hypothetical protein
VSPDREEEIEVEVGTLGPIYNDIICCMDHDVVYKWGEVYYMFQQDTYPEFPLLYGYSDPDEGVYQMIKSFTVAQSSFTLVMFPCAEAISWIIYQADVDNRLIKDTQGKNISSFHTSVIH